MRKNRPCKSIMLLHGRFLCPFSPSAIRVSPGILWGYSRDSWGAWMI